MSAPAQLAVIVPILREAIQATERLPPADRSFARFKIGSYLRQLGLEANFANYGRTEVLRAASTFDPEAKLSESEALTKRLVADGKLDEAEKVFYAANDLRDEVYETTDFIGWLLHVGEHDSALKAFASRKKDRLSNQVYAARQIARVTATAGIGLLRDLRETARADRDVEALVMVGKSLWASGANTEGRDVLREAAGLSLTMSKGPLNNPLDIADCQWAIGDRDGMIETLQGVLRLKPSPAAPDLSPETLQRIGEAGLEQLKELSSRPLGKDEGKTFRMGSVYDEENSKSLEPYVDILTRKGHLAEAAELQAYIANPKTRAHKQWSDWSVGLTLGLARLDLDEEMAEAMASAPEHKAKMLAGIVEVRAEQGRFDVAFVALDEAEAAVPEKERAFVRRAGLIKIKEYAAAAGDVEAWRRAKLMDGGESEGQFGCNRLTALAHAGHVEVAMEFARASDLHSLPDALVAVVEGITNKSALVPGMPAVRGLSPTRFW